jgi:hypothetical protein
LNKNLAIAIVVVLLVVAAVFAYFKITGRELPFGLGGDGTSQDGSSSQGFLGKLSDALKVGTAMKCTYEEGGNAATFWIKSGKLYGDVTTDGNKVEYIFRDNCMYYWSETEDQGLKMCWEESEAPDWEENLAAATEQYNCQPTTISDSKFSLPSGIEFVDMSDYMQQYMPSE